MLLCNANIVGTKGRKDIHVTGQKISAITSHESSLPKSSAEVKLNFENVIAFPGLINSHDHLDFNLFPQIGNRIYNNYSEWGKDIHKRNKATINAVLKIPQSLRIQWGIYKNLLSGVTTIVNHGDKLSIPDNLITVLQNNYSLHSIQFEKKWKLKLNRIFSKKQPYVIHIGEGTDNPSRQEIDELINWNLLKRKIVAVHGVAMNSEQAKYFAALVWCPASNYFLLNATADIEKLKIKTAILFGTDSTLTSGWNIWEHLRIAKKTNMLSNEELFDSVTSTAAAAWNLKDSGKIAEKQFADLVIARKKNDMNDFDSFYDINPKDILLILHKGEVKLFDETLKQQLTDSNFSLSNFSSVYIDNALKHVTGDLPKLIDEIKKYYPTSNFPV
jgi:cytosine/adenosine deaminase-related metal-dependent hydrolase